jgi:hypothetical protein
MLSIGAGFGCKHDEGDDLGQILEHPQGIQAYPPQLLFGLFSACGSFILLIQLKLLNIQLMINPSSP